MKKINQIKLIKISYITVLIVGIMLSFFNGQDAFMEGYKSAGKASRLSFLQGVLLLLISFMGVRVIVYLYRFIDSVQLGNVFSGVNINRLKLMGWYSLIIPFLLFILNSSFFFNNRINSVQPLIFDAIMYVDFEFWLLILGVTLLTIAFVFKNGLKLKQENDLTI